MTDVPSAALRLRDALHRNDGNILGLDLEHERIEIDETRPCTVLIKTDLPTAPDIPLLDVSANEWEIMVEKGGVRHLSNQAFGYLAITRVWRRMGTLGPPARLLGTDLFTIDMVDHSGMRHQDFVDLVWRKSEFASFGMIATDWRDSRPQPESIRFASDREPELVDLPSGMPWLGGHCLPLGVFATAAAFESGWTVSPSLGLPWLAVVSVPRDGNDPVEDLKGRDLSSVLTHPVLRHFELPVAAQRELKRSVRHQVGWTDPGSTGFFGGDDGPLRMLAEEISCLDTTGDSGNSSLVSFFLRFGFG